MSADLPSPDELLRQLEEFARGGSKASTNSSSSSSEEPARRANGSADTRRADTDAAAAGHANGAAALQPAQAAGGNHAARPAASDASAATAAGASATAKPRRLSAAMQPPPSAVFPAGNATAASSSSAAPKRSRIRTSSFSQMQSEREAAAQAERMRQLVLQELNGPAGSSTAAPVAAAAVPAPALPSGPKQRPQASYMAPTLSNAHSTSAAMAAVAAAARAAAEQKEQREIEIATAMRANPPRALLAKKKRPTDPASPPPATDPHPAPARRVVSSYVDLQQMGAGSGALPLTLSQCSQCLVQVLRVMQASVVDAQAMAELFSILADYLPLSPAAAPASGSPRSPASAASTGVPSLDLLIESLQHDQDVLGEAQMLNQAKLLSQMPRDTAQPGAINHERMQRLYRWHLTHVQRKAVATGSAAASKAGSTLNTPRAAPGSAAAAAAATIPASASASGAATPSRAPPAIVDFSFASTQTPVPRSKPVSRPASPAQRSPVGGAPAAAASAAPAAAAGSAVGSSAPDAAISPTPVAATPVSSAAATNASALWSARDGSSSAGSHAASGREFAVSSFFGATARPSHPAAATPIPVRRGRYEDLPSRLLDHFKARGGMYSSSGGFSGAVAGRTRERSSSVNRTRSRSRSSSRTRSGFNEELTPRRSASPSPSTSGASTARAPIPNHALLHASGAGTPRSRSAVGSSSQQQQQQQDYWSVDPVNESTLLRSTSKTPLRAAASFTSAVSAAHAPSVMSTHSRGLLLSDSARAHPDAYVNKPSILPPSLSVGQFSAVDNKMQIAVRESYTRAQRPYPPASSEEGEDEEQGSPEFEEYAADAAAVAAGSGSEPSPDAAFDAASPATDYDAAPSVDPSARRGDDAASPGGDITLPENLNAMVAEIESMNSNLEELLAREAQQDYEQSQRTARILAQRRRTGRPSSLTRSHSSSSSRPPSSSRESIRDQTLRRPRTVFPGSAALYADDPEKLEALETAAARRSRSRVRRGVDPSAPPHVYSPSPRSRGGRPLSPNPHAYQFSSRSSSGVRTAGPPPVPQQRDASYLPYETNLRHRQLSDSLSATLDGLPSPTSRRRVAPTSPPRSPRSPPPRSARSQSSSRTTTPRGSSSGAGSIHGGLSSGALVPHRRLETVPQARHMGYLSPSANAELFRQSSTYATVIAGGSSGGSAQPPISYVRTRSPSRDRSIVDKHKLPQQRSMSYLAPEVNTRFVSDARSWEQKIAGTFEPPIVGAPPAFKYDPATDPALKRPVARAITSQARPMGYLEPGVNAAYLRAAELQEARVAAGAPNGVERSAAQSRAAPRSPRAAPVQRKSAVGSNLAASMDAAAAADGFDRDQERDPDEPALESEPVERTPLRSAIAQQQQQQQQHHQQQHRDAPQHRDRNSASLAPSQQPRPPQQQHQPQHRSARDRELDREWERDRLRAHQAEQDRLDAQMEEAEQRQLDAELWDEQQQRREEEQQEAEEAAWAADEAASAAAAAVPASLDTSPSRSAADVDSSDVSSPNTRRRMSEQAAARHAAQQAAFEETERQWSQQRTPGGRHKMPTSQQGRAQHDPVTLRFDDHSQPQPHQVRRSQGYESRADPVPSLRYDDDDDDADSSYDDAPHAASFMAAHAAAAAAEHGGDNGSSSEADMYYKYLRTRSVGASAAAEPDAYASARDEYDPLAAEQATLAHAQPTQVRRTPQTLRPSKRQP